MLDMTREREPLQVGQRVVLNDPGRPPIQANVVTTQGREVVVVWESEKLLRRNRQLDRPGRD